MQPLRSRQGLVLHRSRLSLAGELLASWSKVIIDLEFHNLVAAIAADRLRLLSGALQQRKFTVAFCALGRAHCASCI